MPHEGLSAVVRGAQVLAKGARGSAPHWVLCQWDVIFPVA